MAHARSGRKILQSVLSIAFSRGLGLVLALGVSVLMANRLGAGAQTDAFFFARRITSGLSESANRVVGIILIPPLVTALQTLDLRGVRRAWRGHILRLLAVPVPLTILAVVLTPLVVKVFGPGMEGERSDIAVVILRILFFVLPFTLFMAISGSLMNAGRRFGVPELFTQSPRIMVILALLFFVPPLGVKGLASVMVAGSVIGGVTLALMANRLLPRLRQESMTGGVVRERGAGKLVWPSIIFFGVSQIAIWVDFGFASTLGTGDLSVLEYGYRLMGILPGLLSASLNTVLYTELSHESDGGTADALGARLARMCRGGFFILAPLVGFMAFQGRAITSVILEHGAFDAEAARLTSDVMVMISVAMAISFLGRTYIFGLYTDENAPHMRVTLVSMAALLISRVVFIALLKGPLGVEGIALGSSLSVVVMLGAVYWELRRYWGRFLAGKDAQGLLLMLIAAAAAMGFARAVDAGLGLTTGSAWIGRVGGLVATGALGAGGYLVLSRLFRLVEVRTAARAVMGRGR